MAPTGTWLLFVIALTVSVIKLRAKFGAHADQETSDATVLTIVSKLPFARHVVPELAVLPKQTIMIILGAAVVVFTGARLTAPPPDTVPDSGLLPLEYSAMASNFVLDEKFILAQKAYDIAARQGGDSDSLKSISSLLPKGPLDQEAVDANLQALSKQAENESEAAKIWQDTIEKYPRFEVPYVHLAQIRIRDKKLEEADKLLTTALSINPGFFNALMNMGDLKSAMNDHKAAREYRNRAIDLSTGSGLESGLTHMLLDKLDEVETEANKSESTNKLEKSENPPDAALKSESPSTDTKTPNKDESTNKQEVQDEDD